MVNFIDSILKVTASEDLNIQNDLQQKESDKSIEELLKNDEESKKQQ